MLAFGENFSPVLAGGFLGKRRQLEEAANTRRSGARQVLPTLYSRAPASFRPYDKLGHYGLFASDTDGEPSIYAARLVAGMVSSSLSAPCSPPGGGAEGGQPFSLTLLRQ